KQLSKRYAPSPPLCDTSPYLGLPERYARVTSLAHTADTDHVLERFPMSQPTLPRRLLLPLALCCAAAVPLAPAWAQGQTDPQTMTSPDGKPLSKGEIKAIKDFQMLDFNKDGK